MLATGNRLQDLGVTRRFTLDVGRSKLRGGVPVLVDLSVECDAIERVRETLAGADSVEHVFTAAEARILFQARFVNGDVRAFIAETLESDDITDYDVILLTHAEWTPQIEGTDLALMYAQGGNTVDEAGETPHLDGEVHYLCCPSCKQQFEERYEQFSADANA